MRRVVRLAAVAGVAAGALMVPAAASAEPAESSCWGQASAVFAQMGRMGDHASEFETPRLGLRNLARSLYESGEFGLPDDSMSSLGAFVAAAEGLEIDACR
jgi:hypothetical protein